MRKTFKILLVTVLCGQAAYAMSKPPRAAHADLVKADGSPAGQAKFVEAAGGVRLTVDASGLAPGVHGLHLHTVGACAAPAFASAGAHWNPTHKAHGLDAPNGAHEGDLPNITIDASGKGKIETLVAGATFDTGALAILDADGTALVIHADPDDNKTDPSGNSGARIACGVVTAG
jgi:Cu-Zn family superoxide dismutase